MARAKNKSTTTTQDKNTWKGFLNIKLSDEEFELIDTITPNIDLGEYLKWLADHGKVTVAFNSVNSTYNCTVVFSGGRLAGYGISSFSDDFREAVSITAFKIEHYHDTVSLDGAASGKARRG